MRALSVRELIDQLERIADDYGDDLETNISEVSPERVEYYDMSTYCGNPEKEPDIASYYVVGIY